MSNETQFFPNVETADQDGFLGWSKELNPAMLLEAYTSAIFPWPTEEEHVLWFSPPERAVLFLKDFRIPKTIQRELKKMNFTFSVNQRFEEVISNCAAVERRDNGTWITSKIIDAYIELHRLGYAWSFEAVDPEGKLAGGLYGVLLGKFFAGESMFHRQTGASKFAFVNMVAWLQQERGTEWIDTQVQNPFLQRFGAANIPRADYLNLLAEVFRRP